MSTYLDLVNLVINESASEADELTSGSWSSAEAGRRIYPRIKRNVKEAWKNIQASRDQWEFMTASMNTTVYPRVKIINGLRAAGTPAVGAVYRVAKGFQLVVKQVLTTGSWTAGTAVGMIEFSDYLEGKLLSGDVFTEVLPLVGNGSFTYLAKGDYSFLEIDPSISNIQWATFNGGATNSTPLPINYVPWDAWFYNTYTFSASTRSAPAYTSQNPQGNVVFYPQNLNPFRVNFTYSLVPQILSAFDDVPRLPSEYHDWIGWEALKKLALFDKNTTLFAYAREQADIYERKAERNLMPLTSYRGSSFNV